MGEGIIPRRGFPVWKSRGRLPEGYTEVEYIKSTGTQYIDTLYKPSTNAVVECEFQCDVISNNTSIYGTRNVAGSENGICFNIDSGGSWNNYYFDYVSNGGTPSANVRYNSKQEANGEFYINGSKIPKHAGSLSPQTMNNNMLIFAWNNAGTPVGLASNLRIYKWVSTENGVLKMSLVPCINPSNQVGMYDLVSQQFFGNAGTGNFIAGEPV